MIYKEVARDRLYDPLATLPKWKKVPIPARLHGAAQGNIKETEDETFERFAAYEQQNSVNIRRSR